MLLAVACDGIDCTGLKRNHTNGAECSWQSSSAHTKQCKKCQGTGRSGGPPGTSHSPSQEQGSQGWKGWAAGAAPAVGPSTSLCSRAHGPSGQGCEELETSPAAASLEQALVALRDWNGVLGPEQGGRSPRRCWAQSGLVVPSEAWKEVVEGGSINILIPRNLEIGSLCKATGIFYLSLWPPEHPKATCLVVSLPLCEALECSICRFFPEWPFVSFWRDTKNRCFRQTSSDTCYFRHFDQVPSD